MKLRYITAAVALVALAACNNEETDLVGYTTDPDAVCISATVGGLTSRSNPTDDAKATQFNPEDRITVATEDQPAVVYKYDGSTWTPEGGYLKWNKDSHEFTAHYPVGYTAGKAVPADQGSVEKIAAADYMASPATPSAKGEAVTLQLERQTARVIFTVKWNDQYADGNYEVKGITLNDGQTTAITPYVTTADGADTYYALLLPTTKDEGAAFMTVTIGDGTDEETLTVKGIPALKQAYSYTYTVTIGKKKASIGSVTVEDWTGNTIDSSQGTMQELTYTFDEGTNTYTVYNADGLMELNQAITSDNSLLSTNITLAADITLPQPAEGGSNWSPMGDNNNPYSGNFDGAGHSITGLVVNNDGDNQGLIGYLSEGGTVQNLTLENCNITGTSWLSYTGGIAGNNKGTISGCTVSQSSVTSYDKSAGGIVGVNYGTISDCSTIGNSSVKGGNSAGGIVGSNDGTVSDCSTVGNSSVEGSMSAGGIVGISSGSISGCTVSHSSVTGSEDVGGIVGFNRSGVSGCIVSNSSVTGRYNVGGIVGNSRAEGTLTACYAYQCTTGETPTAFSGGDNVIAENVGTVTSCYYVAHGESAIYSYDDTATAVEWSAAMEAMNGQLTGWQWGGTYDAPTLTKK